MKRKTVLVIIFILLLFYSLYSVFVLEEVISSGSSIREAESALIAFQRSIWITWILLVSMAVYYKWVKKRNFIFYFTYAFLFVAFAVYGIYVQRLVTAYDVPSSFEDSYTLGVFSALQQILMSAILTGFLQAAVWWFTRRWHRR
ncbi:hypothetical protein HC174_13405 [Salinimicrobium sp. CDJ15-81-2]|nr:hypothetical protein [Salinimicrobium nanhaiense]